jgi:hypothetical protein
VFTRNTLWWLDYYPEFAQHLAQSATVMAASKEFKIYKLTLEQSDNVPRFRNSEIAVSGTRNRLGRRCLSRARRPVHDHAVRFVMGRNCRKRGYRFASQ